MIARPTGITILTVLALGAPACATTGAEREGEVAPAPAEATRPDAEERERMEAIFEARADSALENYTEADVRFMTGMIGHHAQAVVMSRMAPENDASRRVRTLAARIINAQRDEIALMQRWLRLRGLPVPEVHIEGNELTIHGPAHAHHAPGMLTPEQMDELATAEGREFDRLFLRYMIMHHRGAIHMVDELLSHDGAAQDETVFRLAADVRVDQTTEVARMQQMLERLEETGGS